MAAAKKSATMAEALFAVQGELAKVAKDSVNSHFGNTYAGLPVIMETIRPVLQKNGLILSQVMDCTPRTNDPALRTVLMHVESQQLIEGTMPMPTGLNAQQLGSATTYFRRYGILSILGLVADEDDDGNALSKPVVNATPAQATAAAQASAPLPAAPSGDALGGAVVL